MPDEGVAVLRRVEAELTPSGLVMPQFAAMDQGGFVKRRRHPTDSEIRFALTGAGAANRLEETHPTRARGAAAIANRNPEGQQTRIVAATAIRRPAHS
jgi:hypothetical protein